MNFSLIWQTKFAGKFTKSQLLNQELYFTTKVRGQLIHYVYRNKQLLKFTHLYQDKILQFYTSQDHILVTSNTYDVSYVTVINSLNETDLTFLSAMRLFHKGQYVLNIPFQPLWSTKSNVVNIISILIDEFQSQVKLSIVNYQMSLKDGFVQSSMLYQDEITKFYDSSYKSNWAELVKYARKDDRLYIIIGTNHYYVRPYRFFDDRYEVTKLTCLTKEITNRNRIVRLRMSESNLVIQLYNYQSDTNLFYYQNLSTIQHNQDKLQIQFFKLEDMRQSIHNNIITDFQILEQPQATEILFLLQSGDIVIGQLQYPLYVQLMEYAFGPETGEDDFGSIRTSKLWIALTLILIVVKLYPQISAML